MALRKRPVPFDLAAARRHLLRSDETMRGIVKSVGPLEMELRGTPYHSLFRGLLYQQLAGAAAAAIERRLLAFFDGQVPAPEELVKLSPEKMRTAGISRQKASYLHSLSEHALNGGLGLRKLNRMSDDQVIEEVTQIRGVGRWTADMLLIFCLGRPDVLPVGDLGIRASMQRNYSLAELPKPPEMESIAEPWRPYRSAATWYLWRMVDTVTM